MPLTATIMPGGPHTMTRLSLEAAGSCAASSSCVWGGDGRWWGAGGDGGRSGVGGVTVWGEGVEVVGAWQLVESQGREMVGDVR